jgi:putative Holliday junction resolvase
VSEVRTLALDPGERRIGVAITDPTGVIPQPLETIETRRLASAEALERVAELVQRYAVTREVVGLPVHMDGREGPEAVAARAFQTWLERARS